MVQGSRTDHPKMCLQHTDYFKWKTIKDQKTQEETSFSINCTKNLDSPYYRNRAITRDICEEYGLGVVGETWQGLQTRVQSVHHCLHGPANIYQTFVFPPLCELPSSPLKSHYPTHTIQLKIVFDVFEYQRALAFFFFFELLSFPGSHPCIQMITLVLDFLLSICFMST